MTLLADIGGQKHLGRGGGSPGWDGRTCWGLSRKNRCLRTLVFWAGSLTRLLLASRRGGKMLSCHPLQVLASTQMSFDSVAWWRRSWAQSCFALTRVWQCILMACLCGSPVGVFQVAR